MQGFPISLSYFLLILKKYCNFFTPVWFSTMELLQFIKSMSYYWNKKPYFCVISVKSYQDSHQYPWNQSIMIICSPFKKAYVYTFKPCYKLSIRCLFIKIHDKLSIICPITIYLGIGSKYFTLFPIIKYYHLEVPKCYVTNYQFRLIK